MTDPYRILGTSSQASDEEIAQAYKKLARQYHPDLHPGDAMCEQKMKEIISKMDSYGLYSNEKITEQATKIYGLENILAKRVKVLNAVKEKNIEDVIKYTNEYETLLSNYVDVLEDIKQVYGTSIKHMPGNVDNYRLPYADQRLLDYGPVLSMFNGLYSMSTNCKVNNLNVNDVIDDPEIYINKEIENNKEKFMDKYDCKRNGKSLAYNLSLMVTQHNANTLFGEGRIFETLTALELNDEYYENNIISIAVKTEQVNLAGKYGMNPLLEQSKSSDELYPNTDAVKTFIAFGDQLPATAFVIGEDNPSTFKPLEFEVKYNELIKKMTDFAHDLDCDTWYSFSYYLDFDTYYEELDGTDLIREI